MKLNIKRYGLEIVPEDKGYPNCDERDTAFIEEILGLKRDGDWIRLVRKNSNSSVLGCIGYLKTESSKNKEYKDKNKEYKEEFI